MSNNPQDVTLDEKPSQEPESLPHNLNESEREIIDQQLNISKVNISYFSLFRYATGNEIAIMVVAAIASIGAGAVMPLMAVSSLASL